MLSSYTNVLRLPGAWRFSLAGLIMRMPMALVGIAIILTVRAEYGNYTLAGAVSAVDVLAMVVGAPLLARFIDARGQRAVMAPAVVVFVLATAGLAIAALMHAPAGILFVLAALSGLTWGSPGSLVRSRWVQVIRSPQQLNTAYSMEAAFDEFVCVVGPIIATAIGTALKPAIGLFFAAACSGIGGVALLSQRSTEPPVMERNTGERNRSVLRNPVIIILGLTYVGEGVLFGANDVSVVAFAGEHGRPGLAGVLLAFFALGSLVAALVYGARTWTQPLWKLFTAGILLLAAGVSTFLLAHNMLVLALVMWITGLTIAPTMTNVNMIVARVVPPTQLTQGLTWMLAAMNLGTSLGSAVGGRAVDTGGAHTGFLVVVSAAWAMVVLMLIGLPRLRRDTLAVEARDAEKPDLDVPTATVQVPTTTGHIPTLTAEVPIIDPETGTPTGQFPFVSEAEHTH